MELRLDRAGNQKGFSLVEVAISMAIIGIALVPTSQMWVALSQANQVLGRQAEALVVAQQVMEREVRSGSFEALVDRSGTDALTGLTYVLEVETKTPRLKKAEVRIYQNPTAPELIRLVSLAAKETL